MLKPRPGDSPFYLRDSPSGPNSAYRAHSTHFDSNELDNRQLQPRPGPARNKTPGSYSEDYRSVIDDLTIENRKLKQRLRKYEKLHCSHLQQEKLFEVRVHGLPAHKKRELETALRKIAASLDEPNERHASNAPTQQKRQCPISAPQTTIPYRTPAESVYASNATSDMILNPTHHPNHIPREQTLSCADTKHGNGKSYIQDIPQSMVPSRPSEISEKVKKKIIVKRLEQLFTGKFAARRRREFPQQLQEVPTSAAMMESCAREARRGRTAPEGSREARILPMDNESPDSAVGFHSQRSESSGPSPGSCASSQEGGPYQRPTRPMDLDLYRTQIDAENMDYIRRLGLASPLRRSGLPNDEEGWVYLNFLINMAQLHTFSVTPEFVRKAISDISSNIELSPDGQQVRWRGIVAAPLIKSDSGDGPKSRDFGSWPNNHKTSKPLATAAISNWDSTAAPTRRVINSDNAENAHSFDDKPLFSHGKQSEDKYRFNDSDPDGLLEPTEDGGAGLSDSSNAVHSLNIEASSSRRSANGPIIFYKKATFCTDLSGNMQTSPTSNLSYGRYIQQPLGQGQSLTNCESVTTEQWESRVRGLSTTMASATDTDSATSESGLDFPDMESLSLHPGSDDVEPIPFEASGLAGVKPEDNFLVDVAIQHPRLKKPTTPLSSFSNPRRQICRAPHSMPSGSVSAFAVLKETSRTVNHLKTQNQVLSTKITSLPPSSLPQPSYIGLPFSSSDSDDAEADESQSVSEASLVSSNDASSSCRSKNDGDNKTLAGGHLPASIAPSRGSRLMLSDSEAEEDSDESFEMLAYARGRDPWAVAACEMDYDADGAKSISDVPANGSASEEDK